MVNDRIRPVMSVAEESASSVARSPAPKLLLISVLPYFLCPLLVEEFRRVGFNVEVTAPQQQPVRSLAQPPLFHDLGMLNGVSFGPWGARANIRRSIIEARPDLVVPCDDLAARLLRQIGTRASGWLKELIELSVGPASSYAVLGSRSEQVALARRVGVRTPSSVVVSDLSSLLRAAEDIGLPAFLKRDGTWAGEGVAAIEERDDIEAVWSRISSAHLLPSTLRRARQTGWRYALTSTRLRRPMIQLQAAVAGRPANCAVLCKNGEVLAGVTAVAIETTSPTGPASVVLVIQHEEIARVAATLARNLGSNGFFGVDFILSDSGEAFFLEINARPTPIALLPMGARADLIATLFENVTGEPVSQREAITRDLVALFPQEISRDPNSPYLTQAHHYIPNNEPRLVAAALADEPRDRRGPPDRLLKEAEALPRLAPVAQGLHRSS